MAVFVNQFFAAGLAAMSRSVATGELVHVDLQISVAAVAFHFLIIIACVSAYLRLSSKSSRDLAGLAIAFVGQLAYFVAIVALFQPRYLSQFSNILHPHGL